MQEYRELIIILAIVGVIFLGGGYAIGRSSVPVAVVDEGNQPVSYTMDSHNHGQIEVEEDADIPQVTLSANKDSMDGFNFTIETENFTFTPENVGEAAVANEGHAHLYINNIKVMRIYSTNFHIPSSMLEEGNNDVTVTLNANDHSDWTVNEGEHISASVLLDTTSDESLTE